MPRREYIEVGGTCYALGRDDDENATALGAMIAHGIAEAPVLTADGPTGERVVLASVRVGSRPRPACIDCGCPTDQRRGFAGLYICDRCWSRRCGTSK